MLKTTALDYYKTATALAEALGISVAAVSQWETVVPEGSAYKLESLTKRALRVDPKVYGGPVRRAPVSATHHS